MARIATAPEPPPPVAPPPSLGEPATNDAVEEATVDPEPEADDPDPLLAPAPFVVPRSPERESRPAAQPYVLLAGVDLSSPVEDKIARIAAAYFTRTGKRLVCTSGTRDPHSQAAAVHELLRLGADVMRLYRNKDAARELVRLFLSGRAAGKSPDAVTADLATAIRRQIDRGVFLSAHLAERAVDIRSRDMSPSERRAFVEEVAKAGGVRLLEERVPPHFHLQLD